MNGWALAAACGAGLAAWAATGLPAERRWARLVPDRDEPTTVGRPGSPGLLRRFRLVLAALAGCAGITFVDGVAGAVVALVGTGATWLVCTRAEPPGVRREREAVRRGLPHVTRLLAVVLAGGQSVPTALGVVSEALPGPATAPLARARASLAVGIPADRVFAELAVTPGLEPLGRALARSAESGASVTDVVQRLTDQLAAEDRAAVEDRARAVGIRAAVPLGLCLLPAFLLLGIVPVVAAALGELTW